MKSSKAFWDKAAPRYAKSKIKDEESYQKKLAVTQEYLQSDWSVLEFGCGTGSTALIHAPHIKHIIATDVSDTMLSIAEGKRKEAGIDNVTFQQGTLETLAFESASFDAVLGLNILHLLEDMEGSVARVHDLLKPGGVFVSSTALVSEMNGFIKLLIPVMQALGFAPFVNGFDKQTLRSTLAGAGFSIDYEWQPNKESVFIVAKK